MYKGSMWFTSIWMFFVACVICGQQLLAQNTGSGRVYIGQTVNDNITTTVSANAQTGSIPILIQTTTGQQINEQVNISCELTIKDSGYSDALFSFVVLPVGTTQGQVSFNVQLQSAGRENFVRCFAVSTTLFDRTLSLSSPVSFTVTKAAAISFCQGVYQISGPGTLELKFSEAVTNNDIEITCTTTQAASEFMSLSFLDNTVTANTSSQSIQIPFNLTRIGRNVEVTCTAKSQNNGFQFLDSNSGDTAIFTYVLSEGSIQIVPQYTTTSASTIKAFVVLDNLIGPQDPNVVIGCNVFDVKDVAEGRNHALYPVCYVPTLATLPPVETTQSATAVTNATGTTEAQTTAAPTTTAPVTTVGPTSATQQINASEIWFLKEETYVFEPQKTLYQKLEISRVATTSSVSEVILVTCCASEEINTNKAYKNKHGSMIAVVNIPQPITVNWTLVTPAGDTAVETELQNPAYKELSSCDCDFFVDMCDSLCCCDPDCNVTDDLEIFRVCINSTTQSPSEHSCASTHVNMDDWFPLLCFMYENNPLLGFYHPVTSAVRNNVDYRTKASEAKKSYDYRETDNRNVYQTTDTAGYKYGLVVETHTTLSANVGSLSLPTNVLGSCTVTTPIRYLQPSTSVCVLPMSQSLCAAHKVISAQVYAQSSSINHPACPDPIKILAQRSSLQVKASQVSTNYYCTSDYTEYTINTSEKASDYKKTRQLFKNCSIEACDQILPSRCSWDDGYTQAPLPTFANDVCSNTVVSVLYNFSWSGQVITLVTADVILADIPINVSSQITQLTQNFSVIWHHDNENSSRVLERSGNPGYAIGKPLIGGTSVYNSSDALQYLNTAVKPLIWKPGSSGLCYHSSQAVATFGEDSVSGCHLNLGVDDFTDCSNLTQLVLDQLNSLMSVEYLAKTGIPDITNLNDWVYILRDVANVSSANTTVASTDVPTTVNTTTESSTAAATTVTVVTANTTSNVTSNDTMTTTNLPLVDNTAFQVKGFCESVTSGIHLKVMYSEAGLTNGEPIYELVGAAIDYTKESWQFVCRGDGENCSSMVKPFAVMSTVQFIKVPTQLVTANNQKTVKIDPCESYTGVSSGALCWQELFYPLTDNFEHNLALVLAFVFVVICYLIFSIVYTFA